MAAILTGQFHPRPEDAKLFQQLAADSAKAFPALGFQDYMRDVAGMDTLVSGYKGKIPPSTK